MEASPPASTAKAAPIDQTLSDISTTSTIITRFLRSVRTAHADLAAVTRELSDLRLLLELMRDEQDIPLLLQAQALALLVDCRDILLRIRDVLGGCPNSAQWMATARSDMTALRRSLEIFRRALGLVLEVVHLSTLPNDATEVGDIEDQILGEVGQLRIDGTMAEIIDKSAMPVLESYLNAIVNCLQVSDDSSPLQVSQGGMSASRDTRKDWKPPRLESATTTVRDRLEATHLVDQQAPVINVQNSSPTQPDDTRTSSLINRQFETAGPWYPTKDIVLPYYSSPSPSPSPTPTTPAHPTRLGQQEYSPRPSISDAQPGPDSPISPLTKAHPPSPSPPAYSPGYGQGVHSPTLSQQMWNQQIWKNSFNPSPSGRSGSFESRLSPTGDSRSDQWSDPARDFGKGPGGYTHTSNPYHSRDPSIASITSVTSNSAASIGPTDSPRSMFGRVTPSSFSSSYLPSPGTETPNSYASMCKMSASSAYSAHVNTLTPTGHWPPPQTPRPTVSHMISSSSSRTGKRSQADSASPGSRPAPPPRDINPIDIIPTRHLTDKGKPHDVFHIDCSPSTSYIATKHSNNHIKIWSVPRNAIHSNTKITSYVTPQARSREYFIRSHAILSESATLLAITTHFGFNLEIHNFAKSNSSSKKIQTIDEAHRWASTRRDAYQTDYAPLVVYRPKTNRIDKFLLSRHPGSSKKPFTEDPSASIDLARANLPFIPKFPELAYSSNSPFLLAAAGPRPGEHAETNTNPNPNNNIILIAWQMTPTPTPDQQPPAGSCSSSSARSIHTLSSASASDTSSLLGSDGNRPNSSSSFSSTYPSSAHTPHRYTTPSYPILQGSLPSVLVASGTTCVSIWIPAGQPQTLNALPGDGKLRRRPTISAPERFVLVWDFGSSGAGGGTTRMFAIPNVQACVSPDCRFVAYCNPGEGLGTTGKGKGSAGGRFVIVDVRSGEEVWQWPRDSNGGNSNNGGVGVVNGQQTPWASFGGQMEDMSKITVFEFSSDGRMLVVGDASGGLGIYEVKEAGHGPGGRYELAEHNGIGTGTVWPGAGGVVNELQ